MLFLIPFVWNLNHLELMLWSFVQGLLFISSFIFFFFLDNNNTQKKLNSAIQSNFSANSKVGEKLELVKG